MTVVVMPDAETVAISWLKTHPSMLAVIGADRIAQQVNGSTWPRLTAVRVGGTAPVWQRIDRANIDLSAWADDSVEASLIIRTAVGAMHDMPGYQPDGAVVIGVFDVLGPRYLPDTSRAPTIPRYLASLAVTLRPNP